MNNGKLEQKIAQLLDGDNRAFDYIYEQTNRPVYFAILYSCQLHPLPKRPFII